MAHPISPIPSDPTPTWEQICSRLSLTIDTLRRVRDDSPTLAGPARIKVAEALNEYATPLILHLLDALNPPRPTPAEPA